MFNFAVVNRSVYVRRLEEFEAVYKALKPLNDSLLVEAIGETLKHNVQTMMEDTSAFIGALREEMEKHND